MRAIVLAILAILQLGELQEIKDQRLPKNVIPYHYNLTIDISSIATNKFQGSIWIHVDVLEETDKIMLHAVGLNITKIKVHFENGKEVAIARTTEEDYELIVLYLLENLKVGEHTIYMDYASNFSTAAHGLYKVTYLQYINDNTTLVMTHFEMMYARKVFPCFDEPSMKANFTINVIRNKKHFSISNTPLLETLPKSNDKCLDRYETSSKISTYLVAIVVCDFLNISYPRGHIFVHPRKKHRASLAAEISDTAITNFENYFQMPLPMKKLDMILVAVMPGGGMENWGLITFAEHAVLYDASILSRKIKQKAINVIIHEIAHQWIGNVVTMEWWNYQWIKEGTSKLLEHKIGEMMFPNWKLKEQFFMNSLKTSIGIDTKVNVKSISQTASTPNDYHDKFGSISYEKAALILSILNRIVDEECFRRSLQVLLQTYKYSNVIGKDFWNTFDESAQRANKVRNLPANLTLTAIMETWENQAGFPVLNVTRFYSFPYIKLSQERFLLAPTIKKFTSVWHIPINYATKSYPNFKNLTPTDWLITSFKCTDEWNVKPEDWLIVNKESTFYYLVNYDERNWKMIADALNSENFGNIPPLTRAKLLNDAFYLAQAGQLKYSVALEMTKYIRKEMDFIVWNSFLEMFTDFYKHFSGLENFHYYEAFLADALQPSLEHLGFKENETLSAEEQHIDTMNREQIIEHACYLGNKLCRNRTTQRLRELDQVSPDLRGVILRGGMMNADEDLWREMYEISDEDFLVNKTLGYSKNRDILKFFFEIRNYLTIDEICAQGNFGINFVFDYLVENWKKFNDTFLEGPRAWVKPYIINYLSENIKTESQLEKLKYIINSLQMIAYTEKFKAHISNAEIALEQINRHSEDINNWIKQNYIPQPGITLHEILMIVLYTVCGLAILVLLFFIQKFIYNKFLEMMPESSDTST